MLESIVKLAAGVRVLACLFLLLAPLPAAADATSMTLTPLVGYRAGGDYQDAASGSDLDIEDSATFGLILGWDRPRGAFEISYTRQSSEFEGNSRVSPASLVDVDIDNYLFGGKLFVNRDSGAYVTFLLGFTEIDIDSNALDSDLRPSFGFGGGIDRPLSDRMGFRLGLRGIVSMLGSDDDELCKSSGNCPIVLDGNTLVQWDLFAGLNFRF